MKIGNVTIDASDVGNGCLIIGTGVAFYGASAGNPLFAVEALAVGGALKLLLQRSIITYSKNQKPQKLNNFPFWLDMAHLWGYARLQARKKLMDYCDDG